MAYLVVRSAIVLVAWGITCGLIARLWPQADSMAFYVAGASWALAGFGYFGYLRMLRRTAHDQRSRPYSTGPNAA
jgi:hypothetical protein